jgi:hypothetical protein
MLRAFCCGAQRQRKWQLQPEEGDNSGGGGMQQDIAGIGREIFHILVKKILKLLTTKRKQVNSNKIKRDGVRAIQVNRPALSFIC